MAFHDEEKKFIKNQIQKLKASKTYNGEYISNDVLAEKSGCSVNTSASWSAGRKVMSQKYRKRLTEVFSLDPHYFDLEYSEEFIQKQKSAEELNYFLSSTVGVIDTIGVGASKEALQILNETYSFLKTFGFEEVVKKFELQGETASIATLILEWSHVFYCFYQTFEPLLENYCSDKSEITELYRKSVPFGDEGLKNQLTELGKKYSFSLHGTFDELGNIIFDLYEKRPAPKEQGKRGS